MKDYNGFSGKQRERAQRWLNKEWSAGRLAPIRPMVTAPQLMGKAPPIPKVEHCPEERAQLKETWHDADSQMANGDDVVHGLTRAQLKERYIYGDKIIATLGASINAIVMDCEDALSKLLMICLGIDVYFYSNPP